MIARKVGPALAAGCSFVARPSELTLLSALAMAVLGERSGIPKGVLNVITCADASGLGEEFLRQSQGSQDLLHRMHPCWFDAYTSEADGIKKLSLELAGNAPFMLGGAELDKAVEGAIIAKFRNAGQIYVCANRIYIQRGIHNLFAAKLATAVAGLKVGDGVQAGVQIGPLIFELCACKVEDHVAELLLKARR